jgi:KipI family sensor histidine kinase inhibitor
MSGGMRLLPCGDTGLLVELDDLDAVLALHRALSTHRSPGLVDLVPAARTLLLVLDPRVLDVGAAQRLVRETTAEPSDVEALATIEIPVTYDGEDLAEVGRLTGLGVDGVVAAHTGRPWRVAFTGFAPGFGYLVGGDERLRVPRRTDPRTRVPAGAVGLAGEFSGVYPRESPGGWQLVGRTELAMWDVERDPPALLQTGTKVRFVAVG